MDKISQQVSHLISDAGRPWRFDGRTVHVAMQEEGRHQGVDLTREGDYYVLTGVVLSRADVTRSTKRWNDLACLAWQRNAEQELVSFGFDRQDRLIGQIRHLAEHLDPEELDLYIHVLARECDRFEYLLSGKDQY
jgi:hypothetical protein